MIRRALFALVAAVTVFAPTACGEHNADSQDNSTHVQDKPTMLSPAPRSVVIQVFDDPTNIPGKSLVAVTVNYRPGAKSGTHRHARSAFIMVYVISGAIRSQLDDGPARVYHAGETWTEAPGAHHIISENASATEPAELLAVVLLDTGDGPITTYDKAEP